MLEHDACNMETYIFVYFLECCVLRAPNQCKKCKFDSKKLGSKVNSLKNQFNQKCLKFYLWSHKFNVFKRFWKQQKSKKFPAKKSLIKAQFGGENGKIGILALFLLRLRDLGVIFVGIHEANVHTYFGHLFLVLSCFWADFGFLPFLALVIKNCLFWPKPAKIWPDGYSYVHYH